MTAPQRPSQTTVAEWVARFVATGVPALGDPLVLPQDDEENADAFIVLVHLRHAPAAVYLQLDESLRWAATLTERPNDLTGTSLDLIALGAEVGAAGQLCAYLQQRTDAQLAPSP